MDIKQFLPLILQGKLGEKEKALLKATQTRDPAALTSLLTHMYSEKKPSAESYAAFKRLIPAKTLGAIIKYFDSEKKSE